jgi:hypothetical protein
MTKENTRLHDVIRENKVDNETVHDEDSMMFGNFV